MPTLDFKGKRHIYAHHLTVPYRPLVPEPDKSVGVCPDDDNLIIHGDNLHALKALLPRYAGRVKCIYIDPPYNTGNEGWTYNDNANGPILKQWLEQEAKVDIEDQERHDKWLCMMWPRLQLLKELLSEDGVIFVSIDDNEQHHLRMLMDEIFGESNFVACISWQGMDTIKNDAKLFSTNCENVVVYAKELPKLTIQGLLKGDQQRRHYRNRDDDPRGDYLLTPLHAKSGSDSATYDYEFPNGQLWNPPKGTYARYSRATLDRLVGEGRIWLDPDGKKVPQRKTYWSEISSRMPPPTFWEYERFGSTRQANSELSQVLGKGAFDNPKPSKLIAHLVDMIANGDILVLDSFAGSETTAHAVLALNKQDGSNRRFILVECEDYADSVTAERVRRVMAGVPEAKDEQLRGGFGGSFTYCTLGDPVTASGMLNGETLPTFASLAAWLMHTATGQSVGPTELYPLDEHGLIYSDSRRNYYLRYQPDLEWLRSNEAVLTEGRAEEIAAICREEQKEAVVFAAGKYIELDNLSALNIMFGELPFEIRRSEQV